MAHLTLPRSRTLNALLRLGPINFVRNLNIKRTMSQMKDKRPCLLRSRYAKFPIQCRANTSDIAVFTQIFIELEYSCLKHVKDANLIVDCGANIGCSSAYFLSRFKSSRLVAVEPDPGNFEQLKLNMKPYGDRCTAINSGLWSHATRLKMATPTFRDGQEWSRQVEECAGTVPNSFGAIDVGTLLRKSGKSRIDILKIDIEGAEAVVFSRNFEHWLDRVDNLVVELHDDSSFGNATRIFMEAVQGRGFRVGTHGELTVCSR